MKKCFMPLLVKKVPNFTSIIPETLNIDKDVFYHILRKMESGRAISGLSWLEDGTCLYNRMKLNF